MMLHAATTDQPRERDDTRPIVSRAATSRRTRCYTGAMPSPLTLPRLDGSLAPYTLSGRTPIEPPPGPIRSRIGMAAGLAVAEAMDTAQRGMGFDWTAARELIKRSVAEAKTVPGALLASGAGTDHLEPGPRVTLADVEAAYEEQCAWIEGCGGRIILMASRALAACAKSPDDYVKVYGRILSQVREPVIVHWLGEMFDPALAGYWGSRERDRQVETLLAIVREYAAKIDGVKISLLDQAREIAMRRRFPESVRMYTGDDFDYPTTIRGDGQRHSDALLGIFDVIAPAASAALKALDRGDMAAYET